MKRFLSLLALFALLLAPRAAVRAMVALPGTLVTTFNLAPSKVLTDPIQARHRMYVLVPADNTLRVIDTITLAASTIIQLPVDSIPVDMTLSRDHSRLYIANAGSTVHAISVVGNLDGSLGPAPFYVRSISLPGPGLGVAATVDANTGDDLLFVLTTETIIMPNPDPTQPPVVTTITPVLLVDSMTDQIAKNPIGEDNVTHSFVGTSFDGTSVLVAGSLGLEQFRVSDGTRIAADPNLGVNAVQLVESNTGKYLCVPDPAGNGGGSPLTTLLFDANSLNRGTVGYYGTFSDPATPGPLAFTPADLFVYQLRFSTNGPEVVVFSTTTFLETASFPLPTNGLALSVTGRNTIALDSTGSFIFVGVSESFDTDATGQLLVVATGKGPLAPPVFAPVITSVLTATGTESVPFTYAITATNTPTSYGATGLPPGLIVNARTGVISGTTTDIGTFDVTISATNSGGTGTATLALEIDPQIAPVITSALTAFGMEGTPFTYLITASNNPTSYGASGLPAGLTVNALTGVISGTPADIGTFNVTISAANLGGNASAVLALEIDPNPIGEPPVITTTALPNGATGQFYTAPVTATNAPTSYGANGLPPGLSINTTNGTIAGIPTVSGLFSVILSATNDVGTGTVTLPLIITGVAVQRPVITSATTDTVVVGTFIVYQITATNSPTGYGANGLPTGLSINTGSGLISGTVAATGTFPIFLSATNAGGTGTATLTLTVVSAAAPVISSPATASGTLGQGFDYQITANNNPISYAASGLPPGLGIDSGDGLISGVPLAAGTFPVIVSATNVSATGTLSLTLTVASNVPVVTIVATVPKVTSGTDDSAAFTINRTGDLSQVLVVAYSIHGSARNGTDYVTISGRKKIKANKSSATIQIIPKGTDFGNVPKVVKLVLESAVTYQLGTDIKAKIKILPAN